MNGRFIKCKNLLLPALLLLVFVAAGMIGADKVHADGRVWHEVDMKPGYTYDVSVARANTTFYITEAGDYTLKGQSRNARVLVEHGGVDLYLADGLNINCSATSYAGSRSAAIWVKDVDGTIKIISKESADVNLEGYMAPAIRKEGTKSKLVFDTENRNVNGTITAKGGALSSAIGTVTYYPGSNTMGNMTFDGGNIIATSEIASGCAAIGGGYGCNAQNITINDGNIKAYVDLGSAAAIGGGSGGSAKGIVINGGTVYAEVKKGDEDAPAAIGSGYGDNAIAKDIIINGGNVTAINHSEGAAIGANARCRVDNLQINGGVVSATSTGGGSGIGCGLYGTYATITITGGIIRAKGSPDCPGIGVGGNAEKSNHDISISGGTIIAKGGKYDIGGADHGTTTITGGSVSGSISGAVVNDRSDNLHQVEVTFRGLDGPLDSYLLSDLVFSKNTEYGMKDVGLIDYDVTNYSAMFYPWLTDTDELLKQATLETITGQSVKKTTYCGDIKFSDTSGIMDPATAITLVNDNYTLGSAAGIRGEDHLVDLVAPGCQPGTIITGYNNPFDIQVADADGKLLPNVEHYTDQDGHWNHDTDTSMLTATTRPCKYTVHFDGNQPRGASTQITGSMVDFKEREYDKKFTLYKNRFSLPGYDFSAWNTKADGSGTSYTDEAEVKNLTEKDGDTVTLYAQWTPMKYHISLISDDPAKTGEAILTFDRHEKLPDIKELGWTATDKLFHGWSGTALGSFYPDGADMFNYCDIDADGNLETRTLTAEWVSNEKIAVSVTDNGDFVQGLGQCFALLAEDGTMYHLDLTETYSTYVFDPAAMSESLSEGKYTLFFDTSMDLEVEDNYERASATFEYGDDIAVSLTFDYYTLTMKKGEHITSAWFSSSGGIEQPTELENVLKNTDINVQAQAETGYHFDGYTVLGVPPQGFDPSKAIQNKLPVAGKADITAHAKANTYTIHFDANADFGITGEMADQNMVYDQAQDLSANQFERIGATFKGWNTKPDGSGDKFTDGQSVKNLTTENGVTVTLYAQWDIQKYNITYDLAGGALPAGKDNPETYTADDTFTLNDPEKEDYNFVGWLGTDLSTPTQEVTIKKGSTGNKAFFAQWAIKQYTVTFIDNGGTGTDPQIVPIHQKATKPDDPTRDGYLFDGWFADEALTTPFDFDQEITKDTDVYAKWVQTGTTLTKMKAKGGKAMIISWPQAADAEGYDVFFAKCNKKDKKNTCKLAQTIDGNDTFTWTKTGLKKGKAYRAYVRAFVMRDGAKVYITDSPLMHAFANNGTKKLTNAKKVTVKKANITLKAGKTFKIKAAVKPVKKGKKLMPNKHVKKLRYLSMDTSVATVTGGGKIKAKAAGSCDVYVYAHNGVSKKITVNVQ